MKEQLANEHQKCDYECHQEESNHWQASHMFREIPLDFQSLREVADTYQKNRDFLASNLILLKYNENGYKSIFGKKYCVKKCPDPVTEIITEERELFSNKDVADMARDEFAYEIDAK